MIKSLRNICCGLMLKEEIKNILMGIDDIKRNNGEKFTIKQLEKTRKSLENKLESLNNQEKKEYQIVWLNYIQCNDICNLMN